MDQRRPRFRIAVLAIVVALWMGAVLARLGYVQLFRYTDYLARATRQQQRIVETSPRRGAIYDRNLRELAMSISVESAFAVPSEISDTAMVARLLSGVLESPADDIEIKLKSARNFVWIARKLPQEKSDRLKLLNLRGIYFQTESRRFYPKHELAAHALGYVDIDEKGIGGVEQVFDKDVRSKPSRLLILADAKRRWYDRREESAGAGASLVLTLDERIQYIAEKELAAAIGETRAQSGVIVVQQPQTGEILAMASWPVFDPNAPGDSPADARMNRAVTALYEPGSIFKIVTVAGSLEEGQTRPEEVIDCQMGAIVIAGHRIRDHKPFGLLTVSDILAQSSDVGTIKLGLRLGNQRFYDYIRAFGFGQSSGIELPGETRGILRRAENWTPASVGAVSMGQEVGITAVQMVSAFSAIANGGSLVKPRLVREVRRGAQAQMRTTPPPQRVISPQTAATMRRLLGGVVEHGTGKLARLDGWTSGGKTGTAQKINPNTGTYDLRDHIASYVGFAPLESAAVTVLVSLDSPVGAHHGGDVAAPVFQRVTSQVLAVLDVPHDAPADPKLRFARNNNAGTKSRGATVQDVSDFSPAQEENAAVAAEFVAAAQQQRETALRQVALANNSSNHSTRAAAQPPGAILQTVALAPGEGVEVPSLLGQNVRAVTAQCLRLGFAPVLIGTGVAIEQIPEPGTRLREGSRITVRFARAASSAKTAAASAPKASPPAASGGKVLASIRENRD